MDISIISNVSLVMVLIDPVFPTFLQFYRQFTQLQVASTEIPLSPRARHQIAQVCLDWTVLNSWLEESILICSPPLF